MCTRQRRLALLQEELASIEMFDRLREYAAEPDRGDYRREACCQRRAEILAEIAELNAARPVNLALLLCAATACGAFYLFAR